MTMTADEFAKCKRAWETIREMENPARQSIAVALWTGLYAEELLQTAEVAMADALKREARVKRWLPLKDGVSAKARGEQP